MILDLINNENFASNKKLFMHDNNAAFHHV